jgi:hypothetical protein
MLLFIVFIEKIILKYYNDSTWTFWGTWYGNKHVGSGVNWKLFFSNNWIHSKIHLIVDNIFFNTSCIYKSLLIFNLSVIYLKADKHRVITSSLECNYIAADCMGFMSLTRRQNWKFVLMSFQYIDIFLFFHCCNHKGFSSRITGDVLTYIRAILPGIIRLQPVFPKVY